MQCIYPFLNRCRRRRRQSGSICMQWTVYEKQLFTFIRNIIYFHTKVTKCFSDTRNYNMPHACHSLRCTFCAVNKVLLCLKCGNLVLWRARRWEWGNARMDHIHGKWNWRAWERKKEIYKLIISHVIPLYGFSDPKSEIWSCNQEQFNRTTTKKIYRQFSFLKMHLWYSYA